MRLLRVLAPVACVCALYASYPSVSPVAAGKKAGWRAIPGQKDILYAAPGNANYAYGPKLTRLDGMRAEARAAATATFSVTYSGFSLEAQAAFQAAVDIWANTVASPAPIRIRASFVAQDPNQLGAAGPTLLCGGPVSNTFYAAALADKLDGSAFCAALVGETHEIEAEFNSAFTNWEFGTTGVGVPGKYNFMTVVLHEIGHGLGFYGSASSTSGQGRIGYAHQGLPGVFDIFDRFVSNGASSPIVGFTSPSAALHAALVGNNLIFDGPATRANNSNTPAKIESHNFTIAGSDNGFLPGSSYSHADDLQYSNTPNGLMTWALQANEVYTDPGPIVRGIFQDEGWTISGLTCTYTIAPASAVVPAAGVSGTVTLTTQTGCPWTATSSNPGIATIAGAASGTGSATIGYTVASNGAVGPRSATLTIGGNNFTISQNGTGPTMALDRTSLVFTGVNNGASFTSQTGAQVVRMTQSGAGTVSWNAQSNVTWLRVANGSGTPGTFASGTGSATLNISVAFEPGLAATQTGTITLVLTGAGNTAGPITVTLKSVPFGTSVAPIGSFDTPANGITGVAGSVPVTGWALDDVAVTRVRIVRDPVAPEPAGTLVFIGNAVFIDGARPDVQAAFPSHPQSTRAGWGYLMLTNFLPNTGNGTFTIYAIADDADGHSTVLGTKVITCDNANSIAPFGAIDTPRQGEVVSGSTYVNFGWALSPGARRADVPGGGTVSVFVDGVNRGTPGGWGARADITTLFPKAQYDGTDFAVAGLAIDTTALANGVHTIHWGVLDNTGGGAGIGSRFFTVSNGSGLFAAGPADAATGRADTVAARAALDVPAAAVSRIGGRARTLTQEVDAAPADRSPIPGRRGYDPATPMVEYTPEGGRITVHAEELDRIELRVPRGERDPITGYLRTIDGVAPLPVGSVLDAATGTFTWGAGPGFVGRYDLAFVRWSGGRAVARHDVRIVLHPKGSNRVGPQVIVDLPAPTAQGRGPIVVGRAFFLAGWAADLDSGIDRGVDTVHVWAYPVNERGEREEPVFLGPAIYGGARPDVAAVYGDRFRDTGYGMVVTGLAPGAYDVAVFAFSTVRGNFAPAKVVRVIVR